MKEYKPYDVNVLKRCLTWLCAMVVLMMLTKGSAAVLFPIVALGALAQNKTKTLFFVVLMMIVATVGNQFLMPKNIVFAVTVRATLGLLAFFMALQNAGQKTSKFVTPLLGILFYLIWEAAISAQGWSPVVSYLKLILFGAIYFAFYNVANKAATSKGINAYEMRAMVLSIAVFIIGGSAVLVFFPGIGMMNSSDFTDPSRAMLGVSLFKGMMMHSQSLGPIVAGLATLFFADLVFSIKRWDRLYLAILLIAPYIVFKTSSRTAMGSLLGGIGVTTWLLVRAQGIGQRWKGKIINAMTFAVMTFLCFALLMSSVRQKINTFLFKFRQAEASETISFEELTITRQGLVDAAMYNFKKKPLIGNGFQVSEEMLIDKRDDISTYISAPIEKGVWITAVLEEGGAVGFLLFSGFLTVAFSMFVKRRAYISAAILFVMALSNMGEFTFFSLSYTGGLLWLVEFCAVVMDAQRETKQPAVIYYV